MNVCQLFDQDTLVFTNCTARKRAGGPAIAFSDGRRFASLEALACAWRERVCSTVQPRRPAIEVYGGRSVVEGSRSARKLGAELLFVSAGLGLVSASDPIPHYSLTVSEGTGSISRHLRQWGVGPAAWWSALSSALGQSLPLASLLGRNPKAIVYLALPAVYLLLLRDELQGLPAPDVARLRVFSGPAARDVLPASMQHCLLPYDERLEALAGYSGTRSDFAQRALRHYVEALAAHALPLEAGHAAVLGALGALQRPAIPERTRLSDDQITALLRSRWGVCRGESSRLLRHLRDEAMVACEQSRFRKLWLTVKAEHACRGL